MSKRRNRNTASFEQNPTKTFEQDAPRSTWEQTQGKVSPTIVMIGEDGLGQPSIRLGATTPGNAPAWRGSRRWRTSTSKCDRKIIFIQACGPQRRGNAMNTPRFNRIAPTKLNRQPWTRRLANARGRSQSSA